MNTMNAIHVAILKAGGPSQMASALQVTPQAVCFWRDGKRTLPADKCPDIERLYGVACEELRPDVRWDVLRGNAAPAPQPAAQGA